ncbi:glycerophosphodiester phosphodiesterase [Gorillibacterium sp. sgz5001074]|uniref:glycerophosphodiester phosphodiesterase n=1 Tax=Gorillibacterium sp. sgz5001074 TaxID=3446695 RepID=UPI003F6819AB
MKPLVYAHRGASGDAPENTMAAFRLALEQGAEGIELDVQMTADGLLAVIHDETLDRTTDRKGWVGDLTYDEIRRADASFRFPAYKGEPVPLLSQVLELLVPTSLELNIELKNGIRLYDGMEEAAVRLVREYGLEQRVVFSSFNHYSVAKLVRLAPEIESGILYEAGLYRPWDYASTVGARALHPYLYSINRELTDAAHEAGLKVRPWTANSEQEWAALTAAGVDAIITNYPARLLAFLEGQA